jgi:predicted nucleic acid-binding protein
MSSTGVLLDTGFFIRLLNKQMAMHDTAQEYYRYCLENSIVLKCSTISVAEYCVKGSYEDLPLQVVQIVPFNWDHAVRAGKLAAAALRVRGSLPGSGIERSVVINDINLFAQADVDPGIDLFVTSDDRSHALYNAVKAIHPLSFAFVHLSTPYNDAFGVLPLKT